MNEHICLNENEAEEVPSAQETEEKALLHEVEEQDIRNYISEICKVAPIGPDEEAELVRRMLEGNENAKKRLAEGNLRLVVSIAKRFAGRGASLVDLIMEGNSALVKLIEKYGEIGDLRFTNRASLAVKQACIGLVAESHRGLRIPVETVELANRIVREERKFISENGYEPSLNELAEILNMEESDLSKFMSIMREPCGPCELPIDELDDDFDIGPAKTDEDRLYESLPRLSHEDLVQAVRNCCQGRDRDIMLYILGEDERSGKTYSEASEHFGIRIERLRQITRKVARRLKVSDGSSNNRKLKDYLD